MREKWFGGFCWYGSKRQKRERIRELKEWKKNILKKYLGKYFFKKEVWEDNEDYTIQDDDGKTVCITNNVALKFCVGKCKEKIC